MATVVRVVDAGRIEVVTQSLPGSPGERFIVQTFADRMASKPVYQVGDRLVIQVDGPKEEPVATVIERDRTVPYAVLFLLFGAVVVWIGRKQGFISIFAMLGSFFLIANLTVPQIVSGVDPVIVSMITGAFVIPLTFYLSHGFTPKTTLAIFATLGALFLTGALSVLFTYFAQLTGYSTDEAVFVADRFGSSFKMRDLLIAGMIISAMGVLDDVTISQVGIVQSLDKAKPDMKARVLFNEAMRLGRDHIASLVNTLILVYTGAALPLFLLVYQSEVPIWVVMQREAIAEEIVRTLVSSVGIIAAVPLATAIAVKWGRRKIGHLQRERLF
jgi:uncharacterized membrane protein